MDKIVASKLLRDQVSHNRHPPLPSNRKASHNQSPLSLGNPASRNRPPFLSNSDGARMIKELRQRTRRERHPTDVIKDRGETPIFLGGKYLENGRFRLDSNVTDVTTTSTTSQKEGESANSSFSARYFLFPPPTSSIQTSSGHHGDRRQRSDDVIEPSVRKSASFSDLDAPAIGRGIPGRRRSSHSSLVSSRRSSERKERKKSSEQHEKQQANRRILRRRLRVGYLTNDFVSELRMRRRKRPRNSGVKTFTPLERFRKVAAKVRAMIRVLNQYSRVSLVSKFNQMSFAMIYSDYYTARKYRHNLTFDPQDYKAVSERTLNDRARQILTLFPQRRTEEQIQYALKRVRSAVEEFAEFPPRMQEALIRVAWLDEFEPKRIIMREGHKAETFYLIVAGTALVTNNKMAANGEVYVETTQILERGKSFGELAIVRHEDRTHSVVSQTKLTLLTVGRSDFIDIFMPRSSGDEPEFIRFLRPLPPFRNFPLHKIPANRPRLCAFTYFRVGVVICRDSNLSDVIVIVKSGVCRVVKQVMTSRPDLPRLKNIPEDLDYEKVGLNRLPGIKNSEIKPKPIATVPTPSAMTSSQSMLTGARLPSIVRSLTVEQQQKFEKERWSLDQNFLSPFNLNHNRRPGFKPHKRQILQKYNKWQEDHPISQDTFSLLMSERSEEKSEKNEEEEEEDEFEVEYRRISSYVEEISFNGNKKDDVRRDSLESNFRTEILKRNRSSLANAWNFKQKKKFSAADLPTLNEDKAAEPEESIKTGTAPKPVYIHIQYLKEKEIFGLLPILFTEEEGSTSVTLISEGAECVLLNKDLFLRHFDHEQRERLVRMVAPYPSDASLQSKMLEQSNWDAFKFMTVHSHVIERSRDKPVK